MKLKFFFIVKLIFFISIDISARCHGCGIPELQLNGQYAHQETSREGLQSLSGNIDYLSETDMTGFNKDIYPVYGIKFTGNSGKPVFCLFDSDSSVTKLSERTVGEYNLARKLSAGF
jgi:hypothetical protein